MAEIAEIGEKTKHKWAPEIIATAMSFVTGLLPSTGSSIASTLVLGAVKGIGSAVAAEVRSLWPKNPTVQDISTYNAEEIRNAIDSNDAKSSRALTRSAIDLTLGALQGRENADGDAPNDYDAFLDMTTGGRFSDQNAGVISLEDDVQQLLVRQYVDTFLLTTLLEDAGYYPIILPGVDPVAIYQNSNNCPDWAIPDCNQESADLGCEGKNDDSYGLCARFWYSNAHKSSYTLVKAGKKTKIKQSVDIMHAVIDKAIFVRFLFEYSAICTLRTVFPPESRPVYGKWKDDSLSEGFYFTIAAWPEARKSAVPVNDTPRFFPIAPRKGAEGTGFVDLSKDKNKPAIVRPNDSIPIIDQSGDLDPYCMSQLSMAIGNNWAGQHVDEWDRLAPAVDERPPRQWRRRRDTPKHA